MDHIDELPTLKELRRQLGENARRGVFLGEVLHPASGRQVLVR